MVPVLVMMLSCLLAPVEAPVIDPFRPPLCPWCPGNRGLEYGVVAGQPVRAVASGTVSFAGAVAGEQYVTVRLRDGRLLTYGRLATVEVVAGEETVPGRLLGRAGDTFILTLRRDGEYEDPASVLAGRLPARLVRLDGARRPAGSTRCGSGPRWGSFVRVR